MKGSMNENLDKIMDQMERARKPAIEGDPHWFVVCLRTAWNMIEETIEETSKKYEEE